MKWILITALLANPVTYPSKDVCGEALNAVLSQDPRAICIPAGEDRRDAMMQEFLDMVEKLQKMEAEKNRQEWKSSVTQN